MTFQQMKAALHEWLTNSTDLNANRVVWAFQNAPEPSTAFISINPQVSRTRVGVVDSVIPKEDATNAVSDVYNVRRFRASIQAFGEGSIERINGAEDWLENPANYYTTFTANNISLSVDGVNNLSGLKGARYEQRAVMDVTVFMTDVQETTQDPITNFEGEVCISLDDSIEL